MHSPEGRQASCHKHATQSRRRQRVCAATAAPGEGDPSRPPQTGLAAFFLWAGCPTYTRRHQSLARRPREPRLIIRRRVGRHVGRLRRSADWRERHTAAAPLGAAASLAKARDADDRARLGRRRRGARTCAPRAARASLAELAAANWRSETQTRARGTTTGAAERVHRAFKSVAVMRERTMSPARLATS